MIKLLNNISITNDGNKLIIDSVKLQNGLKEIGINPNLVVTIEQTPSGINSVINYENLVVILLEICRELSTQINI